MAVTGDRARHWPSSSFHRAWATIPTMRSPGSTVTRGSSDYRTGEVAFEQLDVEVRPVTWSMSATNILAQKYFRGTLGLPERETSLRQVIDRVVDSITEWGVTDGYFADADEAAIFSDELKHLIVSQKAAFNSPVWFPTSAWKGVPNRLRRVSSSLSRISDDCHPQLVRRRGHDLQGWIGLGRQPLEHPRFQGVPCRWRNGIGAGQSSCVAPMHRLGRSSLVLARTRRWRRW